MSGQVWMNGSLQEGAEVRVSPFDQGWTVGNGVFETLIAYEGTPFAFRRHYERLLQSAAVMALPVVGEQSLRRACDEVIEANGLTAGRGRLRITISGGESRLGSARGESTPTVVVAGVLVEGPTPWADVAVVPYTRNATGALVGVKATSYGENVVALAHAHASGAQEAIFANTAGALCEGAGTNVFLVAEGGLVTPALTSGCLAGVTRALVIELVKSFGLPLSEMEVPMSAFRSAEEAFLTSTIREVQPIRKIDGVALPCVNGSVTGKLREAFAALRDTTLDP